jgi:hypothetical protein
VAAALGGVLILARPTVTAAAPPSLLAGNGSALSVSVGQGLPLQKQVSRVWQHFLNVSRRAGVEWVQLFQDIAAWWRGWLQGALFSIAVASIAVLADRGLVNAWRADGLRSAVTHSALMLYVYACLLFSGGVTLAPKLFLLGALIYGVIQQDLIPDSQIEDVVIIVVAARAFIYACPEALLNEYANRAVAFQRRIASLQRSR